MRLAIVGSRNFSDYELLKSSIDAKEVDHIVSGGAKGADTLAIKFALEFDIPYTEYKPEWDKYGKKAALLRNKLIVSDCDSLIAFWDGKSRGTNYSINLAKQLGKNVKVIYSKKGEEK